MTPEVVERDESDKWEILKFRSEIFSLRAKSKKYFMSVVPQMRSGGDGGDHRDEHNIEVVFFENNQGEFGDQVSEGGTISQSDIPIEAKDLEWWSEFANRYGNRFATMTDNSQPVELFNITFPDIVEYREKRVALLPNELPID